MKLGLGTQCIIRFLHSPLLFFFFFLPVLLPYLFLSNSPTHRHLGGESHDPPSFSHQGPIDAKLAISLDHRCRCRWFATAKEESHGLTS